MDPESKSQMSLNYINFEFGVETLAKLKKNTG